MHHLYKFASVVLLFVYHATGNTGGKNCNNVPHYNFTEKEILKDGSGGPYQLSIDFSTDTLFFSYTSIDNGVTGFKSACINLKNYNFKAIDGIDDGFASTVDQKNHVVYLGGKNVIYVYDYKANLAKPIGGYGIPKIWQLFFKNDLYYTNYPEEQAYILKNDQPIRVQQLRNTRARLLALDNNENIYFSNSSGLFYLEKDDTISSGSISFIGDFNINGFTSDVNGNIFFSTPNALYYIDDESKKVEKLASADNIYGMAIERDGSLIYSLEDSIVRIKATNMQC